MSEDGDGRQEQSPDEGITERVAAILAADAVGYSRLMADDEKATIAALDRARAVFTEHIAANRGRVVDTAGDSVLAVFETTNGAVRASMAIQEGLAALNEGVPKPRQMQFRVGIHLGDIHEKADGTIYGDGVNVAARLEALSEPGAITVSGSVHDSIRDRLDVGFHFLGEHEGKNLKRPVRAFRLLPAQGGSVNATVGSKGGSRRALLRALAASAGVVLVVAGLVWWQMQEPKLRDVVAVEGTPANDPALAMPTGPSIAVLPFANLTGDDSQGYFVDGMTEEIISGLAKFSNLRVLARNSSFQFKGQSIDIPELGRRLNVDYLIDGSVKRDVDTLRVTAQLVDANDGSQIWGESYERELSAATLFAVQDDITSQVIGRIGSVHGAAIQAHLDDMRRSGQVDFQDYDCILLTYEYQRLLTPDKHEVVRDCLEQTVRRNPSYAEAWANLALTYADQHWTGYDGPPNPLELARTAARKAVDLDPDSETAHHGLANVYFFLDEIDAFTIEAEKTLALNPNNTEMVASIGLRFVYVDMRERGVALIEKAMRLNPAHPGWYWFPVSFHHYRSGDYQTALNVARRIDMPEFWYTYLWLAAIYGQLDDEHGAREAITKLNELSPAFKDDPEKFLRMWFKAREARDHFMDGLDKAGLFNEPETSARPIIAVLPFDNLSGDPEQDYFADGITESLISALANSGAIQVIARTSMLKYKGQAIDVRNIGRDLGAGYVLEGTVRKSANQIRITAQLLNAADATHLWSKTYEYPLTADNIFRVQDELTEQVVFAIGGAHGVIAEVRLANTRSRPTDVLDAYDCILRSFHYYTVYTPEEHLKVRSCLQRAVELDPEYDVAWSRLANIILDEHRFTYNPEPKTLDRALEVARTGITLNPQSQYGHNVIAMVYFHRHEIDLFRVHMEKAIELGEFRSELVANVGAYLYFSGDFARGYELMERALELTPNSPGWYQSHRFWEGIRHQHYEASVEAARIYHTKTPGFYWPHLMGAAAYALMGNAEQAQAEIGKLLELRPNFATAAHDELTFWFWTPEGQMIVDRTLEGLRLAGLDIPPTNEGND